MSFWMRRLDFVELLNDFVGCYLSEVSFRSPLRWHIFSVKLQEVLTRFTSFYILGLSRVRSEPPNDRTCCDLNRL